MFRFFYSTQQDSNGQTIYINDDIKSGFNNIIENQKYHDALMRYEVEKHRYKNLALPEVLDVDKVKIHISLTYQDYIDHQEKIKEIIIGHLHDGTLDVFKAVNTENFDKKLQNIKEVMKQWEAYKENLQNDSEEAEKLRQYPELTYCLKENWGEFTELPSTPDEIWCIEQELIRIQKSLERFLNADQFTLYIPKNYNQEKIAQLCQELDTYMKEQKLTPGEKSDVALPLSPHINARLEYFETGEDKERINAVPNKGEPSKRRDKAIEQLQANALYQYLSSIMMVNNTAQEQELEQNTEEQKSNLKPENSITPLQKNSPSSSPSYGKAFLAAAGGIALLGGAIAFGASGVGLPIAAAMIAAAIKAFIVAVGLVAGTAFFLYGAGDIVQKTTESCCSLRT